jgi:hypothetical protein
LTTKDENKVVVSLESSFSQKVEAVMIYFKPALLSTFAEVGNSCEECLPPAFPPFDFSLTIPGRGVV